MKTSLDLPVDLVREMRPARERRKLKDVATEVVRRGLASSTVVPHTAAHRVTLPLIECRVPAKPAAALSPDELGATLLQQEVAWSNVAARP